SATGAPARAARWVPSYETRGSSSDSEQRWGRYLVHTVPVRWPGPCLDDDPSIDETVDDRFCVRGLVDRFEQRVRSEILQVHGSSGFENSNDLVLQRREVRMIDLE